MNGGGNISEQDRHAATNVTTSGSGHKFEIQLGNLCNNRCVFCSSGQFTAMKIARPVPLEPILEALEEARSAGATHITFLGGEPTIHKRFLEAVQKAVDLGFEHVVIFTNGVMFPHPGFIDSVTALGNFEWRISIQGATEEAHVATTGREDSFQRILHGLGELQRRGQRVTTNMCVNERSYRSLPHYPELIRQYGVHQLHVDIVRPESTGPRDEAYMRDIMPRYSAMAPYYAEMLAGFERWNPEFDVNVGNLPHCVLPQWGSSIHHGGEQTVIKSADSIGLGEEPKNKYDWHESLRTHLPTCELCVFRSRCTGIFRAYLGLYGGDEFKPVSREALLALDPERRNFVLLVEPLLAPLRAALAAGDLPQPWRLREEVNEDRRRAVDFVLDAPSARATLRFVRPGRGRAPVIRTPDYDLDVDADLRTPIPALEGLLHWLRACLSAPAMPADGVDLCLRSALLERGRERANAVARRVVARFSLPRWRVNELRWTSDTVGELDANGPANARVTLEFTVGMKNRRSQVDVDFRAGAATADTAAEPAIRALVALLRDDHAPAAATRG